MSEENKKQNNKTPEVAETTQATGSADETQQTEVIPPETTEVANPAASAKESPKPKTDETRKDSETASAEAQQKSSAEPPPAAKTDAEAKAEAKAEAPKAAKPVDPEREARIKAAAERRAAREKAKAAEAAGGKSAEEEAPKPPSPNQPKLDRLVELVKTNVSEDAIEEAYLNEIHNDQPTIIVRAEHLVETAKMLRDHEELNLKYLRNLSGVDYETHFETVYHMISMDRKENYCMKVKIDRENPQVPSVVSVWATANWNEREIYDLLGIDFPGHPDLRRIMLPDDWVGHPLRKDYVPYDPEV